MKKDGLLNAQKSTLKFMKIKKLHEVTKALEKSFKMRPIPLLQLDSFGHSIEKSARGSKIKIVKKIDGENKLPCQLQCNAITKQKELEKRDCTQIKDL